MGGCAKGDRSSSVVEILAATLLLSVTAAPKSSILSARRLGRARKCANPARTGR